MKLNQYKYQFIGIIIALGLGIGGGYYFSDTQSAKVITEIQKLSDERVVKLKEEADSVIKEINKTKKRLTALDSLHRMDTARINHLHKTIEQDRLETEERLKRASKLTPSEKTNYILDRYRTKH